MIQSILLLISLSLTLISAFNCTDAITSLSDCVGNGNITDKCTNCFKTFLNTSDQVCTSSPNRVAQLRVCNSNRNLCDSNEDLCGSYCGAAGDIVPLFKSSFDVCADNSSADACDCYNKLYNDLKDYDICPLSRQTQLSACVRAQLDCPSISGTCKSPESIPLDDLKLYFQKYNNKFKVLWNNTLANDFETTISKVDYDFTGSQWTWTISVSLSPERTTIQAVAEIMKTQFSQTVGLKSDGISVSYSVKKRSILVSEGEIVLTNPIGPDEVPPEPPNPPSSLTWVAAPVLIFVIIMCTLVYIFFIREKKKS